MRNLILSFLSSISKEINPVVAHTIVGNTAFAITEDGVLYVVEEGSFQICFKLRFEIDGETGEPLLAEDDTILPVLEYIIELETMVFASSCGKVFSYQYETSTVVDIMGEMEEGLTNMTWSPDEEVVVFTTGENTLRVMTKDFETINEIKVVEDNELDQVKIIPRMSWRENSETFVVMYPLSEKSHEFKVFTKNGELVSKSEKLKKGTLCIPVSYRLDGRYITACKRESEKNEILLFEKNGLIHDRFEIENTGEVKSIDWNCDSSVLSLSVGNVIQFWTRRNWKWYQKFEINVEEKKVTYQNWDKESPLRFYFFTFDENKKEGKQQLEYNQLNFQWKNNVSAPRLGNLCSVVNGHELLLTPLEVSNIPPPLCVKNLTFPETNINVVSHHHMRKEFLVVTSNGQIHIYYYSSYDMSKPPHFNLDPKRVQSFQIQGDFGRSRLFHFFGKEYIICVLNEKGKDRLMLIQRETGKFVKNIRLKNEEVKEEEEEEHEGEEDEYGLNIKIIDLFSCGSKTYVEDEHGSIYVVDSQIVPFVLEKSEKLSLPQGCLNGSACVRLGYSTSEEMDVVVGLTESGCLYFGDEVIHSNCNSFYADHPSLFFYTTFMNELKMMPKKYTLRQILEFNLKEDEVIEEDAPMKLKTRKRITKEERMEERMKRRMELEDELLSSSKKTTTTSFRKGGRRKKKEESYMYYFRRRVERGSVLICCGGTKVVLQLPRGNLEGVYPKLLAVHEIERRLRLNVVESNLHYGSLLLACLRFKVDPNLIVDVHPKRFADEEGGHLKKFVSEVDSIRYMNVFVASLKEENVIKTTYSHTLLQRPISELEEGMKVSTVLNSLRKILVEISPQKYIRTILTSRITEYRVTGEKRHLELALLDMKTHSSQKMDTILPYLLRMLGKHAYDVFKLALGVYDLRLSKSIAKHSDMDPSEYSFLSILMETEKSDPHYTYFKIDEHLRRNVKALEHLSKCNGLLREHEEKDDDNKSPSFFETEVMKFIGKHHLYLNALSIPIFSSSEQYRKRILFLYGVYLEETCRKDREAAFVFLDCGERDRARECFVESGDFRFVFSMVKDLKKEEVYELGSRLVDRLKDMNRYSEAALVYREYMDEAEESVMLLCEFRIWSEAFRVANLLGRKDLIETDIKPDLIDDADSLLGEIEKNSKKLKKYMERLKELRKEREKMWEEMRKKAFERDGPEGWDDDLLGDPREGALRDDSFSDAGSMMSGLSTYSGVTVFSTFGDSESKNTVSKKKSKRTKLRKGSPYEEVNLVKRIETLIPIPHFQEQVKDVLGVLIFITQTEMARKIQIEFEDMIQYILNNKTEFEKEFAPPIVQGERIEKNTKPDIEKYLGSSFWGWKIEILSRRKN